METRPICLIESSAVTDDLETLNIVCLMPLVRTDRMEMGRASGFVCRFFLCVCDCDHAEDETHHKRERGERHARHWCNGGGGGGVGSKKTKHFLSNSSEKLQREREIKKYFISKHTISFKCFAFFFVLWRRRSSCSRTWGSSATHTPTCLLRSAQTPPYTRHSHGQC